MENNHIKTLKARANLKRTKMQIIADSLTKYFGTSHFLLVNLFIFIIWILLNINIIPNFNPFDPYPFILLITTVSLEAILLSIFVLISQNRQTQIGDLREEIALQVARESERELSKALQMLENVQKSLGIKEKDIKGLRKMEKEFDSDSMTIVLEEEIDR